MGQYTLAQRWRHKESLVRAKAGFGRWRQRLAFSLQPPTGRRTPHGRATLQAFYRSGPTQVLLGRPRWLSKQTRPEEKLSAPDRYRDGRPHSTSSPAAQRHRPADYMEL